jgi:hypothetical protein
VARHVADEWIPEYGGGGGGEEDDVNYRHVPNLCVRAYSSDVGTI